MAEETTKTELRNTHAGSNPAPFTTFYICRKRSKVEAQVAKVFQDMGACDKAEQTLDNLDRFRNASGLRRMESNPAVFQIN